MAIGMFRMIESLKPALTCNPEIQDLSNKPIQNRCFMVQKRRIFSLIFLNKGAPFRQRLVLRLMTGILAKKLMEDKRLRCVAFFATAFL